MVVPTRTGGPGYKPRVKMVKFSAPKLAPRLLGGSLWSEIDQPVVNFDPEFLEEMFKQKVLDKKKKKKPKPEKITFIDPKRANSVGICMNRIKLSFDEILAALLSMDPLQLAPEPQAAADYVRMLMDCAPLEDEAAALAGCSEPASMMADVDLFLMKLMEIPGKLAPRLKCMEMRLSMEEKLFTAAEYVEQKTSACKAVKEALGYKGPRPKPAQPPPGPPTGPPGRGPPPPPPAPGGRGRGPPPPPPPPGGAANDALRYCDVAIADSTLLHPGRGPPGAPPPPPAGGPPAPPPPPAARRGPPGAPPPPPGGRGPGRGPPGPPPPPGARGPAAAAAPLAPHEKYVLSKEEAKGVAESSNLLYLLTTMLDVANFLNHGDRSRGGALGFKLVRRCPLVSLRCMR